MPTVSGKIRINDLARELEVKSKAILEYLPELGIADKRSHSSAIEDEVAEKVRAHFRQTAPPSPAEVQPAPALSETTAKASPATAPRVTHPTAAEPVPMTRTLEQIKLEARRTVQHARPATAEKPAVAPAAGPVSGAPAQPLRRTPGEAAIHTPLAPKPPAPAAPQPPAHAAGPRVASPAVGQSFTQTGTVPAGARETIVAKAAPAVEATAPAKAQETPPAPARHGRGVLKSPDSNQPIYPGVSATKPFPGRSTLPRRPGEHRPMHPTSARPVPGAGAALPSRVPRPSTPRPSAPATPRPHVVPSRPVAPEEVPITRKITITEGVSIKELSEKLGVRAKDVIRRLLDKGIFATINQTLDSETATEIARGFGAETSVISFEDEVIYEVEEADKPEDLVPRAPVVTVMGHVDHGKTSLLDAIRETNVTAREAGGITQHIGAYQVEVKGRKVVFLDTPGHEAFTLMRARGSKVTDIVVLVVAADDGVMPQTLEAINHARAAKVPILVAINKIDKPEAMPERVKKQLADHGLLAEEWGGDTVMVEVSAKQRKNLDLLLEMILLVSDMLGLKANPKRLASGTVLEAKLDRGRGPVATVLVQNGTLRVGDPVIVGSIYGRVRAMFDDRGRPVIEAPPSTPVEVVGLEDVPQAGDRVQAIEDTAKARQIAMHRQAKAREAALAKTARLTLEQLHAQMAAGDVKELPLIVKADVQGSVEVVTDTVTKLSGEKVKVKVIHAGVGAITETDVLLASASNAVIIGFNVRPERKAAELAQLEKVDIRLHTIIYELSEEIKKAMLGLLSPQYKETIVGRAEVRETFRIAKVGTVAGCYVQDGKLSREAQVRLLRDNVVTYEGRIHSLRRFKEDVGEVRSGMECGVSLENFNDIKVGDVIEAYVTEKVAPSL
jgi:translation initiation factor IF-2